MKKHSITHIILFVLIALSSAALADGLEFKARLSGAQEVTDPAGGVMTDAAGRIQVKFDEALTRVRVRLSVRNTDGDRAHFHCAYAGANGPIVVSLFGPPGPGPLPFNGRVARGTLTNADFRAVDCVPEIGRPVTNIASLALAMREGLIYVNFHTPPQFPGGEIRGQLLEDDDDRDNGRDDDDDDDDDDD